MPMRVRSGITRRIDVSYRSNRFALIAMFGALVVAGGTSLIGGSGWWTAVADGVLAGGSSFLAWTIGRELDPDHPVSAGAAAIVAPIILIGGPANLLVVAVLLVAIRVIAGTTGRAPSPVDLAILGVGAAAISFRVGGGAVATVAAIAPALSAWWLRSSIRLLFIGSVAILAVVVAIALFLADQGEWRQPAGFERGLLVGGFAAGLVATWVVPPVRSTADSRRGGRILAGRVRLARLATVTACIGAAAWAGGPGALAVGPAWAALATTAVWSIAALGEEVGPP